MRVIVTRQGEEILKESSQDKKLESFLSQNVGRNSRLVDLKKDSYTHSKFNHTSQGFRPSKSITNIKENKSPSPIRVKNDLSNTPVQQFRRIPVKQHKMTMPKNISDKYNSDNDFRRKNSLLPNLPNNILKKIEVNRKEENSQSNINKPLIDDNFFELTIREAVKDETFKKLRESLKTRKIVKDKNFVLREDNFRTNYKVVNEYSEIKQLVDCKISSEQTNIINYLNRKDEISDKFIRKVCRLDENEMTRLNRVCLKVNHSDSKINLFRKVIKEKMELKSREMKLESTSDLKKAGDWLKRYREISEGYKIIHNREPYVETMNQTKKNFWNRYDFDRLMSRKERKTKQKSETKEAKINDSKDSDK